MNFLAENVRLRLQEKGLDWSDVSWVGTRKRKLNYPTDFIKYKDEDMSDLIDKGIYIVMINRNNGWIEIARESNVFFSVEWRGEPVVPEETGDLLQ